MDVAPATDFDFTFPSHNGECYTSAPSSPTRLTELYCGFDKLLISNGNSSPASVPFAWEEKPGVPKTPANLLEDEFSFNVSCDLNNVEERERGRERGFSTSSSRSRRTRSLSPLGVSNQRRQEAVKSSTAPSSETGSRKWSFVDLLLFRSASDGRAMDSDPLKKYSANFRKHDQDVRNSGSLSKRRGRLSAHELHYNVNRAVSNDMKKKTYLPYKQGILGRFSFNP